jgi:hypothetical protein
VANDPPVDPGPPNGTSDPEPNEERHKIGDFDGSSKVLWTLFGTEAKSYDNACINTLKDDMDGVLIFVCLYSCLLWTFMLMCDMTGWFIFCCPHSICDR